MRFLCTSHPYPENGHPAADRGNCLHCDGGADCIQYGSGCSAHRQTGRVGPLSESVARECSGHDLRKRDEDAYR